MLRFLALSLFLCSLSLQADSPDLSRQARVKAFAAELTAMAEYGPDRLGYLEFAADHLRERYNVEFPESQARRSRARNRNERDDFDAFSLLSGGLAIRESLQLDRIRVFDPAEDTVSLDTLQGPVIKEHPFREMLAGRIVNVPDMARFVPRDFYFLHISDPRKAASLIETLGETAGPALNRFLPAAVDFGTQAKIVRQLGLRIDPANQKYYGFIFHEIAVIGSDPFFGNGADVTVIFRLKRKDTFLSQVSDYRKYFQSQGAAVRAVDIGPVRADLLATPDRSVHSYLISLPGDLVILSNSAAALKRILSVYRKEEPSLADLDEFRYMRSVYPYAPQDEAAFLYLSDPFIRRLTGPEVRIKEARRVMEAGRMAALERYAILYYHLNGRRAESLLELKAEFGEEELERFEGLKVTNASFAASGPLGQIGLLTPNIDFDLKRVSETEAAGYAEFLNQYNSYWRTYFDPVGIRLSGDSRIRIDTCILPLIENSFYRELQEIAGPSVIALGAERALKQEVLSASSRISTEKLGELLNRSSEKYLESNNVKLDEILSEEVQVHVLDALPLVDFDAGILLRETLRGSRRSDKAIVGFLVWSLFHPVRASIPLRSPSAEPKALALIDALGAETARSARGGVRIDRYEQTVEGRKFRVLLISIEEVVKARLYFAVHGGVLHMTTTQEHMMLILKGGLEKTLPERFVEFFRKPAAPATGHLMAVLRPGRLRLERVLAVANAGETAKDAAFENLSTYLLFRNLFGEQFQDASYQSFGFHLDPLTGYRMENGRPMTVFGSPGRAVIDQDKGLAWQEHLNTKEMRLSLEFTKEGLKTVIEIEP